MKVAASIITFGVEVAAMGEDLVREIKESPLIPMRRGGKDLGEVDQVATERCEMQDR